ncbi:MAG TPA: D-alanyl-D-alanine carboxypeptidase/D-alanyl-D-alanine-endopeptidase [Chitinophagaceae bacterium]
MKPGLYLLIAMISSIALRAQTLAEQLDAAVRKTVADSSMLHATLGFYVADASDGAKLFEWNGGTGLAPASTQKIVTAVAAYGLLGKDFRYATQIGYTGELKDGILNGDMVVRGAGDPTFGSNRYGHADAAAVMKEIVEAVQRAGIKQVNGKLYIDASATGYQPLPGGWIWDDIGNYYGAGTWALNWRENQYDLLLKPGAEGTAVEILGTSPELYQLNLVNRLKSGKRGSGDNAYIYQPPYAASGFVEGTYEGGSKISGSIPNPTRQFAFELFRELGAAGILINNNSETVYEPAPACNVFLTHQSPALDSIVYWFMRRSINLYGEALMKTLGSRQTGMGSTDSGVAAVRRFYDEAGIASRSELKIIDGSGLSPSNRVTAESLCKILLYARSQEWFPSFLESFPTYNAMKLKSGTIRGAKSFAGYHTSKDGKTYVVAIIVNNYDGTAGAAVNKLFSLLDLLK